MFKVNLRILFVTVTIFSASCADSQSNPKSGGKDSANMNPLQMNSEAQSKEKAAVKEAAINFLKWDDHVWEGEKVTAVPGARKFLNTLILDARGKPGDQCPCKVNWQSVEKIINWMRINAPVISNQYLADFKKEMKKLEPYLNKIHDNIEAEPPYAAFHFSVGNGGLPALDKTDIYKSTSVWDINFTADSLASVNVTFQLPNDWGSGVSAYGFNMIKEKGFWKAASNMDEGTISAAYKVK